MSKSFYSPIAKCRADGSKHNLHSIISMCERSVERLNHHHAKVLGFRTLYEVFFEVSVSYAKQPLVVALSLESRHINDFREEEFDEF